MGVEVMAAMTAMQMVGTMKGAEKNAQSQRDSAEIRMKNIRMDYMQKAAQKKNSYIARGVAIDAGSTANQVISDTYQTGIDDLRQFRKNAATSIENTMQQGREQMLGQALNFASASGGTQTGNQGMFSGLFSG